MEAIGFLEEHFSDTLEFNGYDKSRTKSEQKDLKRIGKFFYKGVKTRAFWEAIFTYRCKEFPNICLIAEILLCIGPSNSVVEGGFSQLTAMLLDRRLCLSHETMEDLLLIKTNDGVWTNSEREDIIETALQKFL